MPLHFTYLCLCRSQSFNTGIVTWCKQSMIVSIKMIKTGCESEILVKHLQITSKDERVYTELVFNMFLICMSYPMWPICYHLLPITRNVICFSRCLMFRLIFVSTLSSESKKREQEWDPPWSPLWQKAVFGILNNPPGIYDAHEMTLTAKTFLN